MASRKTKEILPEPNYSIQMFKIWKDGNISGFNLEDTKWFYSEKQLKEITYWEKKQKGRIKSKFFTVQKFDPNEVQTKPRRRTKHSGGECGDQAEK